MNPAEAPNSFFSSRWRWASLAFAVVHLCLLWWVASIHSCVHDEAPHLVSGLRFWNSGLNDWYVVNPPLVRNLASIAALPFNLQVDWPEYQIRPDRRPEYNYGRQLLIDNGTRAWHAVIAARWLSAGWSVAGLLLCGLVARSLAGNAAGLAAETLWCFSPLMIGHGAVIVPDVAGATAVLLCCLAAASWINHRTFSHAVLAGIVLGAGLLTKNTLFLLPMAILVTWSVARLTKSAGEPGAGEWWRRLVRDLLQIGAAALAALFVINAAFGFDRTLVPLGDYQFTSDLLGGADRHRSQLDNVFTDTAMARLPVPLPMDYVLGFDVQRSDFAFGNLRFYLLGEWSETGWYHYYLVGLLSKTPLALLALFAIGVVMLVRHREALSRERWIALGLLAMSCGSMFLLVSSQTGLNHHYRYIIPAFPIVLVVAAVAVGLARSRVVRAGLIGLVLLACLESVVRLPHAISFFNIAVGGPSEGDDVLLHTCIDYGQDIPFIQRWAEAHPEARPLRLSLYCRLVTPEIYGVEFDELEMTLEPRRGDIFEFESFQPGCYVVSVMNLHWPGSIYRRALSDRPPDDVIGGPYRVYLIDADEADRLNRRLQREATETKGT